MKSYAHIVSKLFQEPLLITPQRHSALCHLLDAKLAAPNVYDDADPAVGGSEQEDDDLQQMGDTVVIPVHGTLVMHPEDIAMSECGCALEDLNAMIDVADGDSNVRRIIFDFRTPGGSLTGIPETGRKILHSRKETIAFTGSECCSGGIWLAAQCQRFYATESSRVGSVGVYCMMLDMSKALKKDGIKVNAISAGKFKLLGAYWKELSDEEKAILQAGVDKIYVQFKEAMESHRMVSDENFGNGLVFDGQEAAQIGFTDGVVESMEEIIDDLTD
jgi:signal peptide peptidase SppA